MIVDGFMERVHRIAYVLTNGDIDTSIVVRHTCDNPPCCNPGHLVPGTKADNTQDMLMRGRSARGDKNGHATITEETAREIKRRAATNEKRSGIAADLGVSREIVRNIATGRKWKHL